jgi:hypothetical protein
MRAAHNFIEALEAEPVVCLSCFAWRETFQNLEKSRAQRRPGEGMKNVKGATNRD